MNLDDLVVPNVLIVSDNYSHVKAGIDLPMSFSNQVNCVSLFIELTKLGYVSSNHISIIVHTIAQAVCEWR